jgi:hypothetical protein
MKILFAAVAFVAMLNGQTPPPQGTPLYAPLATAPETQRERFLDYAIVTFGPRALFGPAISSAIRMAHPPEAYPRDWKDGPGAFGRIYGASLANKAAKETGRYAAGAILREDFRYRPSASGNPLVRFGHALGYTFVDKSDSGHPRLAVANFVGAGADGFVGELYLPPGFNNRTHAETRMAVAFGDFALQNVLREFAPELGKAARKLKLPIADLPIPEWWVRLKKN